MRFIEFIESFRIAFEALRSNLVRTSLTALGVVIGIALVTLMGWVLKGLDDTWNATVDILGNDMLYVDKWEWAGGGNWAELQSRKNITIQQANEFEEHLKIAELATPMSSWWGRSVIYKDLKADGISVTGVRSNYSQTAAGSVTTGRFFSEAEDHFSKRVVVIGFNVNNAFFPKEDALGKDVKIGGQTFTVIGTIEKRGTAFVDFVDNQVFVPLNTFFAVYGTSARSVSIAVKAGSPEKLDEVRSEVIGAMRAVRNIRPGAKEDFSINETQMFRDQMAKLRFIVLGVGLGLTLLSFVVGSIGIMNVMFVSVVERTKEIGVRKSLGAKRTSILLQFLVESATICLFGAAVAIVFAYIVALIIYALLTFTESGLAKIISPFIPLDILGWAVLISAIVGVVAGFIPAIRASHLDPVEALRFES